MKKLKSVLLAIPLALMALAVVPVQTGCTSVNGTNTFDVTVAATAITAILGPVVVFEENSDPATIVDFQEASAGIGVLLNNNATDVASLQAALSKIGKTPLVKLAISEAVSLYEVTLANSASSGVNQNATAKTLLTAIKAALDQGVKAQTKRMAHHRPALRLK